MIRALFVFALFSLAIPYNAYAQISAGDDDDYPPGRRGWLFRPCYSMQNETNFIEIGLGRINSANSKPEIGLKGVMFASYDFTFGVDFGFGDTASIIAPKMGIEVSATLIGARIMYGYYMQNDRHSGVIGIEGGICIFSVVYGYIGYNFVKGDPETAVIPNGPKVSIGLNIPFGWRDIAPTKRPTHL